MFDRLEDGLSLTNPRDRVFLFLQCPHGPLSRRLAKALQARGAVTMRVAFNAADAMEWRWAGPLFAYDDDLQAFSGWLAAVFRAHAVTDIVLYGDTRPHHRQAIEVARDAGVTTHLLEEGYLRPSWVTYERSGCNASSPVCTVPLQGRAIDEPREPVGTAPWGASNSHRWYALWYYARLLAPSLRFRGVSSRSGLRALPWGDIRCYLRRALILPWVRLRRAAALYRLRQSGRPYHLVLLQLGFDTALRVHSDYASTAEVIGDCVAAFAKSGGADNEMLVFKAHPFEAGRERLRRVIGREARRCGVADRVRFIDGGARLACLLNGARTAVTVNSTAAQQALWRGLPVKALGRAVYARPGLTSGQSLDDFFAAPQPPNLDHVYAHRSAMLRTSQVEGSFYASRGLRQLLRQLPEMMLDPVDPYDRAVDPAQTTQRRDPFDSLSFFSSRSARRPASRRSAA